MQEKLSYPCHELAYLFGCIRLHLGGDVGVGVQGKACGIVPEVVAEGFDVDATLQRNRCEGVAEIVEPDLVHRRDRSLAWVHGYTILRAWVQGEG